MRRFNVLTAGAEHTSEREGYRWQGVRGIGERLGLLRLALDPAGDVPAQQRHPHGTRITGA